MTPLLTPSDLAAHFQCCEKQALAIAAKHGLKAFYLSPRMPRFEAVEVQKVIRKIKTIYSN